MKWAVDRLAEIRATDTSAEIVDGLRDRLEKFGLWPLPPNEMEEFKKAQAAKGLEEPPPNAKRATPKPAKRKRNQDEV